MTSMPPTTECCERPRVYLESSDALTRTWRCGACRTAVRERRPVA